MDQTKLGLAITLTMSEAKELLDNLARAIEEAKDHGQTQPAGLPYTVPGQWFAFHVNPHLNRSLGF
jgi:hypothetical protein